MLWLPAWTLRGPLEMVRLDEAGWPSTCMMGSETGQPAGQTQQKTRLWTQTTQRRRRKNLACFSSLTPSARDSVSALLITNELFTSFHFPLEKF